MTTRPPLAERISIANNVNAERLAGLARLETAGAHREAYAKPCRRHRRQAARFVRQEDHCTPIDRNARAKILMLAEGLERRSKAPGKKNGALGYIGLVVLRALLLQFANATTGLCCPSYTALQCATGLCRQAIADALFRLEQTKLLSITRRLVRERVTRVSPITGQTETITQTVQGSNLYGFAAPAGKLVPLPYRATRRSFFPKRKAESALATVNNPMDAQSRKRSGTLGEHLTKLLGFSMREMTLIQPDPT